MSFSVVGEQCSSQNWAQQPLIESISGMQVNKLSQTLLGPAAWALRALFSSHCPAHPAVPVVHVQPFAADGASRLAVPRLSSAGFPTTVLQVHLGPLESEMVRRSGCL